MPKANLVSTRNISAVSVVSLSLLFALPLWFAAGCGGSGSGNSSGSPSPSPTGTATPTPTPTPVLTNTILFSSNYDTGRINSQVYTLAKDGSSPRRLLTNSADEAACGWSPDGTLVLISSNRDNSSGISNNRDIYTMASDGNNIKRITNDTSKNSYYGAWSPNGKSIAFAHGGKIATMNADGTNITDISGSDLSNPINPVWSPDGSKIAFVADTPGGATHSESVYVMSPDGTNRVAITAGGEYIHQVAWSPDGKTFAFDSSADVGGVTTLRTQIYTMNADGTNRVRLTNNGAQETAPVWSPDGSLILFSSNRDHGGGSGSTNPFDLYTMKPDGTNVTRITTTGTGAFVPPGGWKL